MGEAMPGTVSARGGFRTVGNFEIRRFMGDGCAEAGSLSRPEYAPLRAEGWRGPGPGGGSEWPGCESDAASSLIALMRRSRTASFWILGAMPRSCIGLNSIPAVPTCLMCTCASMIYIRAGF